MSIFTRRGIRKKVQTGRNVRKVEKQQFETIIIFQKRILNAALKKISQGKVTFSTVPGLPGLSGSKSKFLILSSHRVTN